MYFTSTNSVYAYNSTNGRLLRSLPRAPASGLVTNAANGYNRGVALSATASFWLRTTRTRSHSMPRLRTPPRTGYTAAPLYLPWSQLSDHEGFGRRRRRARFCGRGSGQPQFLALLATRGASTFACKQYVALAPPHRWISKGCDSAFQGSRGHWVPPRNGRAPAPYTGVRDTPL
jgi:hypothetical protein